MMNVDRKLIFISHANPEDNTFTLWLASRLTALGYLVWSDVTQLVGAELFWEDIEDAIRNHAAKVIVVLSRTAQRKAGVLDEIAVAVSVERTQGIERFVVPVRIDDLPFDEVKPNLTRKNIIDFKPNWPAGFHMLVKAFERDHVPCSQEKSARETGRWLDQLVADHERIVPGAEKVLSNWFFFKSFPKTLNFFQIPMPNEKLRSYFEAFAYPVNPYRDMIATFASKDDVNDYLLSGHVATNAYWISLSTLLNNAPHQLPELQWHEISRMFSYLIREAWDRAMHAKGLRHYQMANDKKAWYWVHESSTGWVRYADINGVERRKRLVGHSRKRNVYWHYALEAWPFISREPLLMQKPHVVFSEEGKTQLSNDKRMHTLRRGFCKSWWNARWRDLMLAYTSSITDENGEIAIPIGSQQVLVIDPRPMVFQTSVSVTGVAAIQDREDETDEVLDELAEKPDWEFDDEFEEDNLNDDIDVAEEGN